MLKILIAEDDRELRQLFIHVLSRQGYTVTGVENGQQALDALCTGRTTLVVAHRLSTIRNADEIAVVLDGRITERGTHDELIAANGTYKKLYALQFRENDLIE